VNRLVKVSKVLAHWLGVLIVLYISFWVAEEREPKDGFRYFVTAFVVSAILLAVSYILVYLLPLAWSRWRRSSN
jgi:Zn-dependent protease with chaperone function